MITNISRGFTIEPHKTGYYFYCTSMDTNITIRKWLTLEEAIKLNNVLTEKGENKENDPNT